LIFRKGCPGCSHVQGGRQPGHVWFIGDMAPPGAGEAGAETKAYQASASNHHGGTSARGGAGAGPPVASGGPAGGAGAKVKNVGGAGTGGMQLRPAETGVPPLPTTRQGGGPRMGPTPGPNLALLRARRKTYAIGDAFTW
jgi:hypothetical protein